MFGMLKPNSVMNLILKNKYFLYHFNLISYFTYLSKCALFLLMALQAWVLKQCDYDDLFFWPAGRRLRMINWLWEYTDRPMWITTGTVPRLRADIFWGSFCGRRISHRKFGWGFHSFQPPARQHFHRCLPCFTTWPQRNQTLIIRTSLYPPCTACYNVQPSFLCWREFNNVHSADSWKSCDGILCSKRTLEIWNDSNGNPLGHSSPLGQINLLNL